MRNHLKKELKCILKYILIVLDRAPPVVVPTSPAPAPPPVPPVAVPASPASTAAAPTPPPPAAPGANNQTPTKKDPTQVSLDILFVGCLTQRNLDALKTKFQLQYKKAKHCWALSTEIVSELSLVVHTLRLESFSVLVLQLHIFYLGSGRPFLIIDVTIYKDFTT